MLFKMTCKNSNYWNKKVARKSRKTYSLELKKFHIQEKIKLMKLTEEGAKRWYSII